MTVEYSAIGAERECVVRTLDGVVRCPLEAVAMRPRSVLLVLVVVGLAVVLTGCPPAPAGITLRPAAATIEVGESLALDARVQPAKAKQLVRWASDAEGVASVGSTGLVMGIGVGTATITASSVADSRIAASAVITVVRVTGNRAPVADAGPDRIVMVGDTVVLDGGGSSDPDGDVLSFSWSFVAVPSGSAASLSDGSVVAPSFVADRVGVYEVRLTVSDGALEHSDALTVRAEAATGNRPPVAVAGADQVVTVGDTVVLDGGGSSDPDGDALVFAWSFVVVPSGSAASFSDASAVAPSFVADRVGAYEVRLTVSDGALEHSDALTVRVEAAAGNRPPVANAGPNLSVFVGDTVLLDGGGSRDPDGDALVFAWSFVAVPSGSAARLQDHDTSVASFVVDVEGVFQLRLVVSDGVAEDSDEASVAAVAHAPAGTVYVSPEGDDAARGTADAPLRSLAAAIALAHEHPAVTRIRLADGTYERDVEREPFGYRLLRDLEIEGESRDGVVLDAGDASVFSLGRGVELFALRLRLRSTGVAIDVGAAAALSLSQVTCTAQVCVQATDDPGGAQVVIEDAVLSGPGHDQDFSRGVAIRQGDLTLRDSEVRTFGIGIDADGGSVESTRGSIAENGFGVVVSAARLDANATLIAGNSTVGLFAQSTGNVQARNVQVLANGLRGVVVAGEASVYLEGGRVADNGQHHPQTGRFPLPFFGRRGGVDVMDAAAVFVNGTLFKGNNGHVHLGDEALAVFVDSEFRDAAGPDMHGEVGASYGISMNAPEGVLQVEGGVIADNGDGLLLREGRSVLLGVVIQGNLRDGVNVWLGSLRMRDCRMNNSSSGGHDVTITGNPSEIDLGRDGDPGGNLVHGHRTAGPAIYDQRLGRAAPDGLVIMAHGNTCRHWSLPEGQWRERQLDSGQLVIGPADSGVDNCWHIETTNNRIQF